MKKLVVTRHAALVEYPRELGLIDKDTPVVDHVDDPAMLAGRHVFGVLPLNLAVVADRVTIIPLAVSPEDRGKDLSIEKVRTIAGVPATYEVGGT